VSTDAARDERLRPDGPLMLIVDDDAILRERLAMALQARGFQVRTAGSHREALDLARTESAELALVDMRMPGPSGLALIRDLKALEPTTRIVVLTGYGSIETTIDAMRLGAVHYLQKPADADEIVAAFERIEDPPLQRTPPAFEVPSLDRVRWEHIHRVLSDCGGNVSEAARTLGMHRRSLQRILQRSPDLK